MKLFRVFRLIGIMNVDKKDVQNHRNELSAQRKLCKLVLADFQFEKLKAIALEKSTCEYFYGFTVRKGNRRLRRDSPLAEIHRTSSHYHIEPLHL